MGLPGIVEPVKAVQRCYLVALGQCRVVKNRVYKGVDRALETYNGLSDVNEFGCPFTNDMNPQQLVRFSVKQQLQEPGSVV